MVRNVRVVAEPDPLAWTRRLFADLRAGRDVDAFAADFDDAAWRQSFLAVAPHGLDLDLLDVLMKRNLVFASYAWRDADGRRVRSGTAVISWDREGRIMHWTEAP